MLHIIRKLKDIHYAQLMDVYCQSIQGNGQRDYPHLTAAEQRLRAEEALFSYLKAMFETDGNAFCAVWVCDGRYRSALRMERYRDGLLLTALETAPDARNCGYATALVKALLSELQGVRIYSHIDRNNPASLAVHENCGFRRILDHAVYLDGSVLRSSYTYAYDA